MYSEVATGNVTKIRKNSKVFLLVCFTQIYSEIATGNVTKIQKNSKIFLLMCFTLMHSEVATGNVTKIQKNSKNVPIGVFHPHVLRSCHWKCNKNSKKF